MFSHNLLDKKKIRAHRFSSPIYYEGKTKMKQLHTMFQIEPKLMYTVMSFPAFLLALNCVCATD